MNRGQYASSLLHHRSSTIDTSVSNEDVDPNSLWPSPWESATYCVDEELQAEIQVEAINQNLDESLLGVKRNIRGFWLAHESEFRRFWTQMRQESRENFIRDVYPTMVQSLRDRYCIINGTKLYEGRYDRYLILTPWMTVEYLIAGDNLPALIEEWTADNALNLKASKMVIQIRCFVDAGIYPLSAKELEEYSRQRVPQMGDLAVMLLGGALTNSEENSFGSFTQIDNPDYFLHGCMPSPPGDTVNLYKIGTETSMIQLDSIFI